MKKAALMLVCMVASYTLFGQTHWPRPTNFSGSVTANSVLVIDGEESLSEYIEIGAFCGEECRGSALPYETLVAGHRIYFLSIAGNTNNQTITFRLWDHQSDTELEYECKTTVNFQDNLILGQIPNNMFEIEFTVTQTTVTQTINLVAGTNWVSFNVEITLDDLKAALVAASPNTAITIKSQTQKATYNPSNGRWTGRLTSLDMSQMYKITVGTACEITLEGVRINPTEHPVTITPGANWIAYPLNTSMTPQEIFTGFAVPGDMVKSQNQKKQYNSNGRWTGQLGSLEPGKGYIYTSSATEDRVFTFPTGAK